MGRPARALALCAEIEVEAQRRPHTRPGGVISLQIRREWHQAARANRMRTCTLRREITGYRGLGQRNYNWLRLRAVRWYGRRAHSTSASVCSIVPWRISYAEEDTQ